MANEQVERFISKLRKSKAKRVVFSPATERIIKDAELPSPEGVPAASGGTASQHTRKISRGIR